MEMVYHKVSLAIRRIDLLLWTTNLFRLLAVLLGGIHAWAAVISFSMNADGISYLDIGDAYWKGDWSAAINAVWSPLYSWILGGAVRLVQPGMTMEFPLVQMVNFLIYLGTILCFELFLHQVLELHSTQRIEASRERDLVIPDWGLVALCYSLFIWSSLTQIEIWSVTPDMLMSGLVYLAAGQILKLRKGNRTNLNFIILGLVLGLGYLTKAVMFPLAFVFFAVAFFTSTFTFYGWRKTFQALLFGVVIFLIVCLPFITAISMHEGHFTIGEAGKMTYIRYVSGIPYPYWQGEMPGNGSPIHPSRKVFDDPAIYEFASPIGGTYPISYDPSYWFAGVKAQPDVRKQVVALFTNLVFYFDLFIHQLGGLTTGIIALYLLGQWRRKKLKEIFQDWGLGIVSLSAFALYSLVYVEGRYIAVFLTLFFVDLLAGVRLVESNITRKLVSAIPIAMVFFQMANLVLYNLHGLGDLNSRVAAVNGTDAAVRSPTWPVEVADELHRLGLGPGDPVAVIGYAFDSYWARLAKVRIIAEMPGSEADKFWLGKTSFQEEVIEAFTRTGARAIVAENVPSYAMLSSTWEIAGSTNSFISLIKP